MLENRTDLAAALELMQLEVARLRAERDELREANKGMREFIAELNNTARHEWARAVDEATHKLFRKMSGNPIIRDSLVDAALASKEPTDAG